MARSLYICYFGVSEPLVQTQVIPYLRELVKGGHELTLLTFEPGEVDEEAVRRSLEADGIEWHWLKYHKRPSVPATLFDVANGARFLRKLAVKKKFDIFHCRSHVPMMMAAIARRSMTQRVKLLFDIRGFLLDEYADAGVWLAGGLLYRGAKRMEKRLLKVSDGFVVLTEAAREVLFPESASNGRDDLGRPVEVIPCCVDFDDRFAAVDAVSKEDAKRELGAEGRFVVTHLGALGGLYLNNEIADLLAEARSKYRDLFAVFLTQSDSELITPLLKERGFSEADIMVRKVSAADVPRYLMASDVGLSFVKSSYATISRSPTKIPEYLACGLPIIANSGVGDVDSLINENCAGALVRDFTKTEYRSAVEKVVSLKGAEKRLEQIAREKFDLRTVGGARYKRLYRELLSR